MKEEKHIIWSNDNLDYEDWRDDLGSGWKKKRHDPAGKRWPSKFFNWTDRKSVV